MVFVVCIEYHPAVGVKKLTGSQKCILEKLVTFEVKAITIQPCTIRLYRRNNNDSKRISVLLKACHNLTEFGFANDSHIKITTQPNG
jgi:hypothetical protein